MGYLDKTTMSVTAHFTKRGREILATALSGVTDDSYVITQFALGDDEIDYGLWDETQASNLEGRIIENMPVLESFVNEQEIMNYFKIKPSKEIGIIKEYIKNSILDGKIQNNKESAKLLMIKKGESLGLKNNAIE